MTHAAARKRRKVTGGSSQGFRLARRQRHLEDVERNRYQHVVAAHAHQIDHALLAEGVDGALVVGRGDPVGLEIFGDEVVDDPLDIAREGRGLARADRLDDPSAQSRFPGQPRMGAGVAIASLGLSLLLTRRPAAL